MATKKQNKQVAPINKNRFACEKDYQVIVYDDFSGFPMKVTFLDGRWWITSPGLILQPLEEFLDGMEAEYFLLCEVGEKVGVLALAKMLGQALENPADKVDETLRHRVEDLKRLGVMLDVKDEALAVELRVFQNREDSMRKGKFSMWCYLAGNFGEMLFDCDGFESRKDAEEWADYYFECLGELGVEYVIY